MLVRRTNLLRSCAAMSVLLACSRCAAPGDGPRASAQKATSSGVNVLTRSYDKLRSGANVSETTLSPASVGPRSFGKLFELSVDDQVYAQVLYVSGLTIAGLLRNVVYVATVNDTVYAFDADTGALLWQRNLNGAGRAARVQDNPELEQTYNFTSRVGIVSTPVIDDAKTTLYCVTNTVNSAGQSYMLRALDLLTGAERAGSPVRIVPSLPETDGGADAGIAPFEPAFANQRPGLGLANDAVYVAFASYSDRGPYHGWIFAYDAPTLTLTSSFDVTPSGVQGGIWQSGAAPAFDADGNLFITTGNGSFDGVTNYGQTLLKLAPRTLHVLDYFTPADFVDMNSRDIDFGSGGPSLLPERKLVLNGGKNGRVYVLDSQALGKNVSGDTQILQRLDAVSAAPRPTARHHLHGNVVVWERGATLDMYVWGENDYLRKYRFDPSTRRFPPMAAAVGSVLPPIGMPGGMLALSANGAQAGTGIVWATMPASGDSNNHTVPGALRAFDAESLALLWESRSPGDDPYSFPKYNPPTVVNGKVYVASFSGAISVYGSRSGPTPPIVSGKYRLRAHTTDTQCLQVSGGALTGGATIEQQECGSSDAQRWSISNIANDLYEIRSAVTGKCLDVKGGASSSGAVVQQYACNATAAQRWEVVAMGAGLYRLQPQTGPNRCLEIASGSTAPGALARQWACNGSNAQSFSLVVDDEIPAMVTKGTYRIEPVATPRQCVTAPVVLKKVGAVKHVACDGSDEQRWRLTRVVSDTYEIRAASGERCLDVKGASTEAGAEIQQYTCNGTLAQRWLVRALSSARYELLPQKGAGLCLETVTTSDRLQQSACDDAPPQLFTIIAP